jgi:metal-responsive CopG/Arc/MetJ family transcriptional regulator
MKVSRSVRFDVRMPPDLAQDMKDIEEDTGLSRGEIFRRAITLYKRMKKTQMEGGNVILLEADGTLIKLVGF